jgi:uncharacterized BrkB/YihY/UPF0761 family membrane protein
VKRRALGVAPLLAFVIVGALRDAARADAPLPAAVAPQQEAPPPPKRTGAKIGGLASAALIGFGVFFAFEAQTARAHDINPTNDDQQRSSVLSFATYMSFGLAVISLIVTTVLLLGESSGTKP